MTQNENLPIALIHMAQLDSTSAKSLLEAYDNVYFITSHSNPVAIANSSQPWTNLFDGDIIAADWRDLMITYSNRFIFALDNVWPEHWASERYQSQMDIWKSAMADLPDSVAHAIAHENAERLWSIQ